VEVQCDGNGVVIQVLEFFQVKFMRKVPVAVKNSEDHLKAGREAILALSKGRSGSFSAL
jgi:hypothetical protein